MTHHLRTSLREALAGRVCFVGVGNRDLGDDGFGVRLAEELEAAGCPHVLVAGTTPERCMPELAAKCFQNVVFLDAVETDGETGSVVLLEASALRSRFPQISTHKISLGTLARVLESEANTRVWLLGTRPHCLKAATRLSPPLQETLRILKKCILEALVQNDGMSRRPLPLVAETYDS